MRDYLIIATVLASLPIGLFRPFYGLLVYAWIGYMYPHELAWGFAKTFPVAKLSAVSLIAGSLINGGIRLRLLRERENLLMIALWIIFTISSVFAINPDNAWSRWQDLSKIILIALMVSMLLTEQKRFRYFLLVVALSLGFYGFKGGIFSLLSGGESMVLGPGDSVIGANNNLGLALNMVLPILWYVAAQEQGWRKRLLQCGFVLTIPSILFTYSRASELTMPIIILAIALRSKHRLVFITVLLLGAVLAAPIIPQRFWNRINTVSTYEEDDSAMSRIDNWKMCWRLALDYPLTGAGFDFQSREVFAKYSPDFLVKYNGKVWDTHNIYLSLLAGHGFPGLFVFVTMILSSIWNCERMQWKVRKREDLRWISDYCKLAQISLLALLINGIFVNMEFFELVYQAIGVVVALKVVCHRELSLSESVLQEPSLPWLPGHNLAAQE